MMEHITRHIKVNHSYYFRNLDKALDSYSHYDNKAISGRI